MQLNGWVDLSTRGRIRATGEDRKRLVHAMTTNNIQALEPGQSSYTFFLSAQGRILADAVVACYADHLLLDTEPETRTKVFQHLDRFIIADDVTLEDITDQTAEVAASIVPEALTPSYVNFGLAHYVMPAAEKAAFVAALKLPELSAGEYRQWRMGNGIPRYGDDISEANLVHETPLLAQAVHFSKGCYLGQEIVERVRSRGQVNKQIISLRIESRTPPEKGTRLMAGPVDVGEITSAAYIPGQQAVRAFALARLEILKSGPLQVGGAPAQVIQQS